MLYEKYLNVIDEKAEELCAVSDALYDNPETAYGEYYAVELVTKKLRENGFTVTENVLGIATAFKATYGTGKPNLGILAEYDALSGMSQEGFNPREKLFPELKIVTAADIIFSAQGHLLQLWL